MEPKKKGSSVFVGNMPYDAQEEELREIFSKVGQVNSVRLVYDKETKQPKGYGFVDFTDQNTAQEAIRTMCNVEYNQRRLRVDWAESALRGGGPDALPTLGGGGPSGKAPPISASPAILTGATVADRWAQIQEREAAEAAKATAEDNAMRQEIARLMETLSVGQLFYVLGEAQKLALTAPNVARALVAENPQLAFALQHAQFMVGMINDPPLPLSPEEHTNIKDLAARVRNEVVGGSQSSTLPPSQPPVPQVPASGGPGMIPGGGMMVPFGQPAPLVPGQMMAPPPVAPGSRGPGSSQEEEKQKFLKRLLHLTPEEIDRLPEETKMKLLQFLAQQQQGTGPGM